MGYLSRSFDPWPSEVTSRARRRPQAMEHDDPLARVRAERRRAIIDELLPKLRRINPLWTDDEILEAAESMAELRLLDEEMG